jgi:hypothetical protein
VITIVSGLPRSGTSLMMQMLGAGGMTILTDFERKPDPDNPRGYYEWEPAKRLPRQPKLIDQAEEKAVKIVSQLLLSLPERRDYKIIFMERPLPQVLASQEEMLRRRGQLDSAGSELMAAGFRDHLMEVQAWLMERPNIPVCRIGYRKLLHDPPVAARAVRDFLGLDLNVEAMVGQVDPSLYRNRQP